MKAMSSMWSTCAVSSEHMLAHEILKRQSDFWVMLASDSVCDRQTLRVNGKCLFIQNKETKTIQL